VRTIPLFFEHKCLVYSRYRSESQHPMVVPRPFEIHVSDEALADLQSRLARTRWPDEAVDNDDWAYGANTTYIRNLAKFWHDCDWRQQEAYLNGGFGCGAKHYKVRLPAGNEPGAGLDIHYVKAVAKSGPGIPLLLLHGWPGSWYEFHKLFKPLSEAGFDVVAPSLPGYGYSEAPHTRGFGLVSMAHSMILLMNTLGYPSFVAQGGDWGAAICLALGQLSSTRPQHAACKAVHFNAGTALQPPRDVVKELAKGYTEWDMKGMAGGRDYQQHDSGYSKIQGTKPQTIGTALNDSPSGLLAWIVEKLRHWSDCGGDPEKCFSKLDMITNVAMYWYGGAATSSARLYYEGGFGRGEEREHVEHADIGKAKVSIPVGFALFPKDIAWSPKSHIEWTYSDIRRFQIMPLGGHFAAWEQPELLGTEIIQFFLKDVDAKALCAVAHHTSRL